MTTPTYFGWHDVSAKTTDAARLESAVQAFTAKHGVQPVRVLVNVAQKPNPMPLLCAGMVVDTEAWVPLGRVMVEKVSG